MRTLKTGTLLLLLPFLLLVGSGAAYGMELTALYHMGNLSFDEDSKSAETSLDGTDYPWGLSLYGEHEISSKLDLKAGFFYDPVLRNTTYTLFEYADEFFRIGVGPFFGVFNSKSSILKSGISTSVRIEFPGVVFASLRSDSSIAARFTKTGDYMQERNVITFGYYIPNAICTLNLTTKRYVTQKTSSLETDDAFTEYSFDVDIYQKNVPVQVLLSFAYQERTRTYDFEAASDQSNTLHSLVLGTRFTVEVSPKVAVIADFDHNVYSFGKYDDGSNSGTLSLPDSGPGIYLFQGSVGMRLQL
jgi:hypothetical protein